MQKQAQIVAMFDSIAPSYDKLNRILSFGVDKSWRKKAIKEVLKCAPQSVEIVDVACGTGDMIALWRDLAAKFHTQIVKIQGLDPSEEMLNIARKKFTNTEFIKAYAQNLPLNDGSADILSISYGIRNVTERQKAFSEFARVLKKGGILLILEFTRREKGGILGTLRDFYLAKILPKIGRLISKNATAYTYLPESIDGFLSKDELISELEKAGFSMLKYQKFSLGISSGFVMRKV